MVSQAIILEEESTVDCAPPSVTIVNQAPRLTDPARFSLGQNLVIEGRLTLNCAETRKNIQAWKLEKVRGEVGKGNRGGDPAPRSERGQGQLWF